MNTISARRIIVTASTTAIGITGTWAATPAEATTATGGSGTYTSSAAEIDQAVVIAKRKMQTADDYVTHALHPPRSPSSRRRPDRFASSRCPPVLRRRTFRAARSYEQQVPSAR